jgi:hypothetical protein
LGVAEASGTESILAVFITAICLGVRGGPSMNVRIALVLCATLIADVACVAQQKGTGVVTGNFCDAPELAKAGPGYTKEDIEQQPDKTADLPSVVQTVEQALKCYQALSGEKDPMQPKGLPKLNSAEMDFKTTTGKTVGFTFSIFVFKVGASREKDVTDELKFTYSVPKKIALPKTVGLAKVNPVPLYEELVKEVQEAARAAQAQSTALGMPLSKVSISISYGIKFDGNVSVNVPVQLVTIGGNGDYNKNNTQTITLTFGEPGQ